VPEPTLTATATPLRASLPATARDAAILSVGVELPEGVLTTAELAERLDLSEEWIMSRTGIRERRRAAPDERLSGAPVSMPPTLTSCSWPP
jgi:3-oxoacyl-[acyl-carrier-protein] synthase-3